MSYLCEKCTKKLRVIDFVSEIKRAENYSDFGTLPQVIQHGLQGLWLKVYIEDAIFDILTRTDGGKRF